MRTALKLAVFGAALASIVAASRPAAAWDSICYAFQDPTRNVAELLPIDGTRGCEGIEAARGRWRDAPVQEDEHRHIFELAATQLGLPASVLQTQRLPVLTDLSSVFVVGATGATSTVDPRPPALAHRAVVRAFSLDELAQLPDFSYSLWDWARGNETCPLNLGNATFNDAQTCHAFKTHMGATNSNHFPPQSDGWFAHYHGLAIARADQCRAARAAVWNAEPVNRRAATDARFASFYRGCEVEALAYEAVAQHFLQDSWSGGHMWQRWGSTDIHKMADIQATGNQPEVAQWNGVTPEDRQLFVAEMVAVSSGTIHGSDAGLFDLLSQPFSFSLHDAMCYPTSSVQANDGGSILHVVGDMHVHDVIAVPPVHSTISVVPVLFDTALLQGQAQRMMGCAAGSLGEVYSKLGDPGAGHFGDPVLGPQGIAAPPFTVAGCRAPKATNRAMAAGIDLTDVQPGLGEALGGVLSPDIPDSVESLARNDYARLRFNAGLLARYKPDGTEISDLHIPANMPFDDEFCDDEVPQTCTPFTYTVQAHLFTMLKAEPNRCYDVSGVATAGCTAPSPAADPPSQLVDRELTLPLSPPAINTPAGAIAVAFHASRAGQLCDAVTAADLAALPAVVANAESSAERAAACDACAEWVAPFLRIGQDMSDYDKTAEPLCHFASAAPDNVPYVYEPATGTADGTTLARRHCGCKGLVAVTDAGLKRLVATPSGGTMTLTQTGATVPVGTLPRDVAAASAGRLLVANGQGQIVGIRDDAEVDMDGNPGNGVTRLTFSGVGDLQGLAVVNTGGKELLLAAATATGEPIAWDLTNNVPCDRFSVAQVAGQAAYDVAVSADASTVWVSLRKVSPLSGAVASVSLPAIAQCNGSALATVQWLVTPGAAAGLGPMALSPDGSRLAVGGRLAGTCPDQIKAADGSTTVDTQVGCDRVFVLDVSTKTWMQFGINLSMPTRPGRYPYAIAWFQDSLRMAYASFAGIDNLGNGDSGWPANFSAAPRIPVGGMLRLADTSTPSYSGGGGGPASLRNWTYNMPLNGYVIGQTVVVDGGAFYGAGWVFVGTGAGRVSAYAVAPHDSTPDPLWEGANADPETALHMSTNGGWYGGCSHPCGLVGGVCPVVCGPGNAPPGFGSIELGSGVRVLAAY